MSQRDVLQHSVAYWEQPEQVIWVDLPNRRLQGYDTYWVASDSYGVANDTDSPLDYQGLQSVAWRLVDEKEYVTDSDHIPIDAVVYRGFMLTDTQARFVGLL